MATLCPSVEHARANQDHRRHEREEDRGRIEVQRGLVGRPHPPLDGCGIRARCGDGEADNAELGDECRLSGPGRDEARRFRDEPDPQCQRDPAPGKSPAAHLDVPALEREREADCRGGETDELGARRAEGREDGGEKNSDTEADNNQRTA